MLAEGRWHDWGGGTVLEVPRKIGTADTVIAGQLGASVNVLSGESRLPVDDCVGVVAVIEEFRMVAGQHHATLHLRRNVSIHVHIISKRLRRSRDCLERYDKIDAARELPDGLASPQVFCREAAQTVNSARRNEGANNEHQGAFYKDGSGGHSPQLCIRARSRFMKRSPISVR